MVFFFSLFNFHAANPESFVFFLYTSVSMSTRWQTKIEPKTAARTKKKKYEFSKSIRSFSLYFFLCSSVLVLVFASFFLQYWIHIRSLNRFWCSRIHTPQSTYIDKIHKTHDGNWYKPTKEHTKNKPKNVHFSSARFFLALYSLHKYKANGMTMGDVCFWFGVLAFVNRSWCGKLSKFNHGMSNGLKLNENV